MSIRILIVENHLAVRNALKLTLSLDPGLEVIGAAGNGKEAVELFEALSPDLILMDLLMPEQAGLSAIREIHAHQPGLPIIGLTSTYDPQLMRLAVAQGARACLLKTVTGQALRETIVQIFGDSQRVRGAHPSPGLEKGETDVSGDQGA